MKISAIKQQVKDAERVSVFVDGKYEFSLSLDELLREKVTNGQELTPADIKKFKKISADGKLRARALEWVLNRPRSIREFRDYMYRKKAEPEMTDSLIEQFSKSGYLNEQKFGEWFIDLQKRRGKSDRAIRAELFKKGIGRELVGELLAADADDETARLKSLIEKKQKLSRYKNDRKKLMQYLVAQGFSWDDIKQQLDETSTEWQ